MSVESPNSINSTNYLLAGETSASLLIGQRARDWSMLREVVLVCIGHIQKHVRGLLGELRNAQCLENGLCEPPLYDARVTVIEARNDTALLGAYCRENHEKYAQMIHQRMETLRNLCASIDQSQIGCVTDLCEIVWTAYTLRHSSLLRCWLQKNLRLHTKSITMAKLIEDILKRVGKLSRFFRATLTIAKFVKVLGQITTSITVIGLETQRVQVNELRCRTEANLRARSRNLLEGIPGSRLNSKLRLWDRYRVHAEIQLLLFYEQNKDVVLVVNYIGCDKLCCYLCYHFITTHAKFRVNGCHQSLYSLWMIPAKIPGLSPQAIDHVHDVLARLCTLLQDKVRQISGPAKFKCSYHPGGESCDNLSRASFLTNLEHQQSLLRQHLGVAIDVAPDAVSEHVLRMMRETPTGSTGDICRSEQKQKQSCKPGSNSPTCTKSGLSLPLVTVASQSSKTRESDTSMSDLSRLQENSRARPFKDPDSQQWKVHAEFMKDHESRACVIPIAYDARESGSRCRPRASYTIDTSRKIDVHELELFFDVELPTTAIVHVKPGETPRTPDSRVMDIAEMQYGQDYVIEFDIENAQGRELFLSTQQRNGTKQWLKLIWDNVA